jgi:UDP-glucose 6-dehydrogenase
VRTKKGKNMKKIAIVGHGYVGKACEYGFNTKKNKIQLIDPFLYNNSVDDMTDVDVSFVCVPTPFGADGQIDASIVVDVTNKLIEKTTGLIVIKSTVIPSIVKELSTKNSRVIYNPEFLTERNALEDFINPPMHIFGGEAKSVDILENLYNKFSRCKPAPVYKMAAQDAAFVKYGINSFLATKVMWFNQYKEIILLLLLALIPGLVTVILRFLVLMVAVVLVVLVSPKIQMLYQHLLGQIISLF